MLRGFSGELSAKLHESDRRSCDHEDIVRMRLLVLTSTALELEPQVEMRGLLGLGEKSKEFPPLAEQNDEQVVFRTAAVAS